MQLMQRMRCVTAMLSVVAVAVMAAGVGAQEKPNFAGEWKMVATDGQGEPGVDLIITQDATSLTVDYKRGGPTSGSGPVKLTYTLDGSPSKNTTAASGAPAGQVSKATWAGNNIVATTTTGAGEETRTFSMQDGDLVVETSAFTRKGGTPTVAKVTYKRYLRGFGG
jgi:hypothetical protein